MTETERIAIHQAYEHELARMLRLAQACAATTAQLVATMKRGVSR